MGTPRRKMLVIRDSQDTERNVRWGARCPVESPRMRTAQMLVLFLAFLSGIVGSHGFGYMSTIAASYGEAGVVCAIEASGEQQVLCWGRNNSQVVTLSTSVPEPFLAISGGDGFMCGLKARSSQPFCWQGNNTDVNTIPQEYQTQSYKSLAAGAYHVCGIPATPSRYGNLARVDCWGTSANGGSFPTPSLSALESIVAGNGFACGVYKQTKTAVCWGDSQRNVTTPLKKVRFESLSAGRDHVCGIAMRSKVAICWGDNSRGQADAPTNISFMAIASGFYHTCGILNSSHEVQCWGDASINRTVVPVGADFMALTAASNVTCGVRENNLLAVCWGDGANYQPPLELFSPGICGSAPCGRGEFAFNSSVIDSTLPSICFNRSQRVCAPCAGTCPPGTFLSSACSADSDRQCTDCSLCQNSLCQAVCRAHSIPVGAPFSDIYKTTVRDEGTGAIVAAATVGGVVVALLCALLLCVVYRKRVTHSLFRCGSKTRDSVENGLMQTSSCATSISGHTRKPSHEMIRMQAFRLAELRDATNGFKELNELGRGSYGFVYKALLPDGRQVAVKRANAARRIHCNSRDFESELELLCKLRHSQLVNLVGYCEEMGERLLVYEFMPNGTLHDHLHGGLAQLSWALRYKIAVQSARGIEYLHKDACPRVVHKDIKSSNILLDGDWNARVADFGLSLSAGVPSGDAKDERMSPVQQSAVGYTDPDYFKSQSFTDKSDVYSFGVVLLEILCGRKAFDTDYSIPSIVAWAAPYVQQGKAASILDSSLELPKSVDPLLRVAEIAELCVRQAPDERPGISDVAAWLELVGRGHAL